MGTSVLGKAKNNESWGSVGSCKPPGGPERCLGERVDANLLNNFAFFFLIKHAKMAMVRLNTG